MKKKKHVREYVFYFESDVLGRCFLRADDRRWKRLCSLLWRGEDDLSVGSCNRLECLSDRLLCMRRIATPCSSVEKSKPRCISCSPVDISVRLPTRMSIEGRRGSRDMSPKLSALDTVDILLAMRECLRDSRDVDRDTREEGRCKRLRAFMRSASRPISRWGSYFLIHRMISISSGA
jgi:hypothetical protein